MGGLRNKINKEPITFRMKASVQFNRDINPEKDYISPGGYEMEIDGQLVQFDFEESCSGRSVDDSSILEIETRNPMYDEYPDICHLKKNMFKNITNITEFFIYTGEPGETDLKPIALKKVSFIFPYEKWEQIHVSKAVLENAILSSNIE